MVEVRLYKDEKNYAQNPFRTMVVPVVDIDAESGILTVPSLDGKETFSFYFVEYVRNEATTFSFYKVDKKTN